jgi:hypothetical protein
MPVREGQYDPDADYAASLQAEQAERGIMHHSQAIGGLADVIDDELEQVLTQADIIAATQANALNKVGAL